MSFNITHAQQYLDSFQAPLCWNGKIRSILIKLGFSLNESDYGIYSQKLGRGLVLLASASSAKAESAKNKLASIFKMKNIGSASYFLWVRIQQIKEFITHDVAKYVTDTLQYFGMPESKTILTPLPSINLSKFKNTDTDADATFSRSIVSKLI